MAKRYRLSPNQAAKLKANFAGLKTITDYDPPKTEYEVAAIQPIEDALDDLTEQESKMLAQLEELRDKIADKGKEFEQKMKGVGQQIVAQYGDDAPELQKVGRIRSSERAPRQLKKKDGE